MVGTLASVSSRRIAVVRWVHHQLSLQRLGLEFRTGLPETRPTEVPPRPRDDTVSDATRPSPECAGTRTVPFVVLPNGGR